MFSTRRLKPVRATTRWMAPSILLAVAAVTGPCSSGPAHPMGVNPTGAYQIEISVSGGPFVSRLIGFEGAGCEPFANDEEADRTCRIAISLIPSHIGGEAYGELNDRHTPALDALIWRARANADASVCAQGGLTGAFLQECERDAVADEYEYATGNMLVRVPIGGAQPSPSLSP